MFSKKNILYIGNALSGKGKTKTSIETLGVFLEDICYVKIASKKKNKILRSLDMIGLVLKNSNRTDYVLIDTYSTSNFYYALIISQLCRLLKLRYITILRGGNLEKRLIKNPIYSKLLFKNAYKLIAPSRFLENVFENYDYNNIVYIPNTIQVKNYSYYPRNIEVIKLLWVRSFSYVYNPEMAIHVLEKLLEMNYETKLTMVGPEVDGAMDKVMDLAKRKGLSVNFTGKLSKKDWIELSKEHNIFINTTNVDNTPVSVIEAMALGLPIVSTNVGGIPFLISNEINGLLVQPNNVEAMINAILRFKNDEELKNRLVNNARSKIEKFDWEVVKPKWEEVLS